MRGIVETYDGHNGPIRAKSGTIYPFARTAMVRRAHAWQGDRLLLRMVTTRSGSR